MNSQQITVADLSKILAHLNPKLTLLFGVNEHHIMAFDKDGGIGMDEVQYQIVDLASTRDLEKEGVGAFLQVNHQVNWPIFDKLK